MQKSDDLRKNAENCAEKAQTATTPQDKARFKRAWHGRISQTAKMVRRRLGGSAPAAT
jgi:hypothetical protein